MRSKRIYILIAILFYLNIGFAGYKVDAERIINPGTITETLLDSNVQNKLSTLEITDGTTSSVSTKKLYFNPSSGFHLIIDGDTTEVNLGSAFKYFITDDGTVEAIGGEDTLKLKTGGSNISIFKSDTKEINVLVNTVNFTLNNHKYIPGTINFHDDCEGTDGTPYTTTPYSATDGLYLQWEYKSNYSNDSYHKYEDVYNGVTAYNGSTFYYNYFAGYLKLDTKENTTDNIISTFYIGNGASATFAFYNAYNLSSTLFSIDLTFNATDNTYSYYYNGSSPYYPMNGQWLKTTVIVNQVTKTFYIYFDDVLRITDTYSGDSLLKTIYLSKGIYDNITITNSTYQLNDVTFRYREDVNAFQDVFYLFKDSYISQFLRFQLPTNLNYIQNKGNPRTGEIAYDTSEQNIYCYDGSEYYIAGGKRTALRDKQVCFYVGDSIFDNFTDFINWKNNADEGDICIISDDFTAPSGVQFHKGEIRQLRGSLASVVTNFTQADTGEVIVVFNTGSEYGTIVSPDMDDSDLGILVDINKLKGTDIDNSKPLEDGDILVYDNSKEAWVNSAPGSSQVIEYGNIYMSYPYGTKTTQVFYRPDHYRLFTSGNYGTGSYVLTYYGIYDDTNNYNIFATDLYDSNMTIEVGNGARWALNPITNTVACFGGYDTANSSRCRSIIFINLNTNTKEISSDYGGDYVCHAGFTYNKNRDKYYLYEGSTQELDVMGEGGFYVPGSNKSYIYDKSTNTWTQSDTYLDLFKKAMNYMDTPESEIGVNVIAFSYGDYNYVLGNFREGQYDPNNDSWSYYPIIYNIKIDTSNNDVTYIGSIASPYVYYNDVPNTTLYMYGSVECYVGGSTTFTRVRLTPTVYALDYSTDTFTYYPDYPIKSDKIFIFKKSNYLYIYNLDQSQGFGGYRLDLTNPAQWEEVPSGTEYKYVYNNSYITTPSITATLNPQNYVTGEPLKQIVIKQSNQTECVFKTYEYNNGVQPAYTSSFSYQIIGQ